MDPKTAELLKEWQASLTPKERRLHIDLAPTGLKKCLNLGPDDRDNGSYYPEKSHAFKAWLKARSAAKHS